MTVAIKRERISLAFILALFIGACVILYPYLGNEWNKLTNTRAITNYRDKTKSFTQEEINHFFDEANAYNRALCTLQDPFEEFHVLEYYNDILNVDGEGMMAYVNIPKINVSLAIIHGFDDRTLNRACGHLEGTSLPVGGVNTHSVISAHRGMPSAKLFSDLNLMEIGDYFNIEVLDETLYYQVDQIKVVEQNDSSDLHIIEGRDLLTLLTCTPYGINTHRLLVRGTRVDNPYGFVDSLRSEAHRLDAYMICLFLSLFILLVIFMWVMLKYKRDQNILNSQLDELERQYIVNTIGEQNKKD